MEKSENVPSKGNIGRQTDQSDGAEVGGRAKPFLYTCYNCGAGNYVDPSWTHFSCWRCGGHSEHSDP
jgi:hypothetical protein